ncbi:MAG TPA: hypothetical protein VMV43_04085 [Candidatus Nanopelagicaceae bacterium]|nr:hypothetical protein [Candidatus Nanopelagicaceae bacterium]
MMSLNATEKIDYDFLAAKKIFQEIGFEVIGTKFINEDKYFVVKKKKK